ncbi:PepSY domain-containing protein [Roseibacillus persicicus]|uniref:PepSY domain-containing protein n=1 Tax=Roseibacillus persicicus TaxID=454148 RepID=UPI00167B649B|nr:PepSY domain-containing protein [Roseibacillus persicicus]
MRRLRHRQYHRWLGLALALPLLWLCVTGVILNHSAELRLDQRTLSSPFLNRLYLDLPKRDEGKTLAVGKRQVTQWGDDLFLDEGLLPLSGELIGAISLGPNLLLGTRDHLYLLGPNGELIDSLGEASLPEHPLKALIANPEAVLVTEEGSYALDGDLLDFPAAETPGDAEPKFLSLADSEQDVLAKELELTLIAQSPVSFYRVLLDLHKFAFLGGLGKWVLTLSTLGLIVLLATGLKLLKQRKRATPS